MHTTTGKVLAASAAVETVADSLCGGDCAAVVRKARAVAPGPLK
jgi:hypothetical protein